jgi:transposase
MGWIRKTTSREHETPRRIRFKCLVEQGYSHSEAARRANVKRTTALGWLYKPDRRTGSQRPGRPPIISDEQVRSMIEWITGHFDRRALPLQEIAKAYRIQACDDTILAAFARHGYHYHIPDCKPFLSKIAKRKRWTFSIQHWDKSVFGGGKDIMQMNP